MGFFETARNDDAPGAPTLKPWKAFRGRFVRLFPWRWRKRSRPSLPPAPCPKNTVFEPKWDGWRSCGPALGNASSRSAPLPRQIQPAHSKAHPLSQPYRIIIIGVLSKRSLDEKIVPTRQARLLRHLQRRTSDRQPVRAACRKCVWSHRRRQLHNNSARQPEESVPRRSQPQRNRLRSGRRVDLSVWGQGGFIGRP